MSEPLSITEREELLLLNIREAVANGLVLIEAGGNKMLVERFLKKAIKNINKLLTDIGEEHGKKKQESEGPGTIKPGG